MLPQRNATLTEVRRDGSTEDYDSPAGSGANLLDKRCDAYLSDRATIASTGGDLNRTILSYVLVPGDTGIEFEPDDVLIFADGRTRVVAEVRDRQMVGLPPQPIRLELQAA